MAKKVSNKLGNYKLNLKNLCTPSLIYFVISLISLIIMGVQNINGKSDSLCLGNYNCNVGSKLLVFVLYGIYITFWTFIFDLMCKAGYSELSWFIVLIPFILFFLFLAIIIYKTA